MSAFWRRCLELVLVLCLLSPVVASAQNTTSAAPVYLFPGQPANYYLDNTPANAARWYRTELFAGRSYCVEVSNDAVLEYFGADPKVFVYATDATTQIAVNDDATEPEGYLGSRACWIHTAAGGSYPFIKATTFTTPPGTRYFQLRFVETTLWCPWFFIDGDYNAFTLIRNATNTAVSITVTWRNAAGTAVGTYSGSIPADGNLSLSARTYVTGATTGSIEIAHNGSPDAIQASTTTLSGTTGVGFDAQFGQRRPW
jgi:hypothetical protein